MDKKNIKIGDVVWVKLFGQDHVQKGVRPAVVIQNNRGNYYSSTIQVFPLTSRCYKSSLPTHVFIPAGIAGLAKDSIVQCEAARTVDKKHILSNIGHLPDEYMARISLASIIGAPLIQYLTIEEIAEVHAKVRILS